MISKNMTKTMIEKAEKLAAGTGIDKRINILLEMLQAMLKEMIRKAGGDFERLQFKGGFLLKLDKKILYPLIVEEEGPIPELTLKGYPFPFEPAKIIKHQEKIFIPILIDKDIITCHFFGFASYQQLMSKSVPDLIAGLSSNQRVVRAGKLIPLHQLVGKK